VRRLASWVLPQLRAARLAAAAAVAIDRQAWYTDRMNEVAKQAEDGRMASLWRLVRQLSKKRQSVRIMHISGAAVEPPLTWQRRFLDEFGGAGAITTLDQFQQSAADLALVPDAHLRPARCLGRLPAATLEPLLCQELRWLKGDRAVGDDLIPSEYMRAAGDGYSKVFAALASAAVDFHVPLAWRGGTMTPVPRKPGLALSVANSRGILLCAAPAKVLAKVVRRQLAPLLPDLLGPFQCGAISGGGVEYPAHAARLFLRQARLNGRSAAVLFGDMRAAFYSVLPEVFLGPLLPLAQRTELYSMLGIDGIDKLRLDGLCAAAPSQLISAGISECWRDLLADWHRANWFGVQDSSDVVMTQRGVRPGDPVADVVFVCVFALFLKALIPRLALLGVVHELPSPMRALLLGNMQVSSLPSRWFSPTWMTLQSRLMPLRLCSFSRCSGVRQT
jgi:hypothetical protein